jgi:iron complex outermembrane receptor protein
MRTRMLDWQKRLLAGASLALMASTSAVQAQSVPSGGGLSLEEIIVTARRKDESLQDVPQTINAVTGSEIEKLNFRRFEDLAAVVPGLSMTTNANGIGATASVRGVAYDVNASGNNGTVEFYQNDAPISAGNLFQTVYDVQQVELLRGPQGTLRGRASPSGSMTVTTRRPDLSEMGGYVSGTGTDIGGYNGQGAISVPIINDMLAIRIAGSYEKNENNRVQSINSSEDPETKTKSGRATISYKPTDDLSFILTFQDTKNEITTFDQVQSQQSVFPGAAVNPGAPGATAAPRFIKADDRLAVENAPRRIEQNFKNYNLQAEWAFAGQKLNYVGARNEQHFESLEQADVGDFFPSNYPAFLQGFGQFTDSHATANAHELRLSSEERIAERFSYIVGAFYQKLDAPTDLTRPTPVLFGLPSPTVAGLINLTPIKRRGGNTEKSVFANLAMQIGDATELSAGARYIKYHSDGSLFVSGARLAAADEDRDDNATIYTISLKHNFSDDLMVYATTGTSWRAGISATGDFSIARSPLENSFLILDPEESTSYEIGVKASALDKRLRGSLSVYHQKFDNYPYRSASGVFFVETPAPGLTRVSPFNFVAAVPVEVNGVEADVAFQPVSSWDIGAVAAYSKGEIQDGLIPCNDYSPRDGVPDSSGAVPTVAGIQAATGGGTISGCTTNYRSSLSPLWSASLQSEFRVPITSALTGYARGLLSLYGSSQNDPTNANDDYDGYELFNAYLGVRDANGQWEVSLYGKNLFDKQEVLTRNSSLATTSYNIGATGVTGLTNYYGGNATSGLNMTPPREFGITMRYSFGSR